LSDTVALSHVQIAVLAAAALSALLLWRRAPLWVHFDARALATQRPARNESASINP
jgi:hypothetical protein